MVYMMNNAPAYLAVSIAESMICTAPRYGRTADGYTAKSGAPTGIKIRLSGEKIWRRVMVWQFSNAGTLFVKIKGRCFIVPDYCIP